MSLLQRQYIEMVDPEAKTAVERFDVETGHDIFRRTQYVQLEGNHVPNAWLFAGAADAI